MADTQTTSAPAAATEAKTDGVPPVKVFVGNLSFKTKEEELQTQFGECGKVVSTNIIMRGTRSLGYGFVEMATVEDANKAVAAMNKKSIDEREINVELAKPRKEGEQAERKAPKKRRTGRTRRGKRSGDEEKKEGEAVSEEKKAAPAPGKEGEAAKDGARRTRRPRNRQRRSRAAAKTERPQVTRIPSETTLYVANLPFSVDDEALTALFKDLKATKAHVVRKKSNNRSKGFGFVEFANSDDQKAALEKMNAHEVEGRQLTVKIAEVPDPASAPAPAEAAATEAPAAEAAAPAAEAPAAAKE